jgi:hypothetical protein
MQCFATSRGKATCALRRADKCGNRRAPATTLYTFATSSARSLLVDESHLRRNCYPRTTHTTPNSNQELGYSCPRKKSRDCPLAVSCFRFEKRTLAQHYRPVHTSDLPTRIAAEKQRRKGERLMMRTRFWKLDPVLGLWVWRWNLSLGQPGWRVWG